MSSKKTGISTKETRMLLTRGFFNRRYIVRNILSATVLITFLVLAVGISAVVTGDAADEETLSTLADDKQIEATIKNDFQTTTTEEAKPQTETTELHADNTEAEETQVSALDTTLVSNSKYANRFIAIEGGINIRSGAGTDYDAIGYLEAGMVGEFLGTEDEWSNIAVGDLVGYVKSEFILVGDAAVDYAEANSFDIDAVVYYEAVEEETYEETESEDVTEDEYVEEEYTEEEIYEDTDIEDTETSEDVTEEAVDESEGEDTEATEEEPENQSKPIESVNRGEFSLSDEDITLIAAIVALEAGSESYEGQLAVANIVLNRLNSGLWGNTIKDVVYAPNQFDVAYWDSFAAYIEAGASGVALQATLDAVSGNNNIGSYLSYRPTYFLENGTYENYTIIGNHFFF